MNLLLILFFISLAGIVFMIGRKLILLQTEPVPTENNFLFEIPDSKDVKHIAARNIKKYGFMLLVITIRSYIKTLNYTKKKTNDLYDKAHKIITRNKIQKSNSNGEVSKFLKKISEYKQKINKIKHQIVEEEKNQS